MALEQQINQNLAYASENEMFDTAFSWEPKRQHQFIMEVQGIPSYLIKTSAKPSMTNGEVALDMINVKRYVKGKSEWNDISITLYDPIVPSGAQAVMEWVRLHAESVTGRMGYAAGYKKDVDLEMLDPTGVAVEKWILQGCSITDAKFGDLGYDKTDIMTVTITLMPDRCILVY